MHPGTLTMCHLWATASLPTLTRAACVQATQFTMTSRGTKYPRPLLTSARPTGELHDCTVLPLNVPEFSTIVNTAAAARRLLETARANQAAAGCFILRTESLFRGFYCNRCAHAASLPIARSAVQQGGQAGSAYDLMPFATHMSPAMQHWGLAVHGRQRRVLCASLG